MNRRRLLAFYTVFVLVLVAVCLGLRVALFSSSGSPYWPEFVTFLLIVLTALAAGQLASFFFFTRRDNLAMEGLLAEEQKKLRLMEYSLDHSSELVSWIDRDNRLCNINRKALEILGYDITEILGKTPALIDASFDASAMDRLWSDLKSGRFHLFQTSYKTKSGDLIPVEIVFNYFAYQHEEYICAFARDISERKRAVAEVKAAKEMLELFLEGLPGGAFVKDLGGHLLYANRTLKAFPPFSTEGVWEESVVSETDRIIQKDRQAFEEGPVTEEYDAYPVLGHHSIFEVWKFPMRVPGQSPMIGGVVFDITKRKLGERLLFENQAFLEATINQSPMGIIILDGKTTNIKVCNNGAKDILGIPQEEDLVGKTVSFDGLIWEVLTPERTAFPLEQNPLYKAFFHESTSNDKMIIRRTDGEERFVLINSGPIYDKKGEFLAAIVAFLDITELKETQDQLQELNKRLEQMVDDRTWELMRANETLRTTIEDLRRTQDQLIESEKFASLGSLVAGVAHEINTPVGVGVTAASYLRETTEGIQKLFAAEKMRRSDLEGFLTNAVQSAQIILSNLDRASNLIKSFKMISVDQSTDQKRKFRLKAYFEDVFLSLHPPDKRLSIKVTVEGDAALEINSYPGAFSQIITNLYMNSCTHGFEGMGQGEVRLSFELREKTLLVRYKDDGRGMDDVTLKKIYEPFFTTRRDLGGTGLGMNIVFNLVNQKLGGTIKAASSPGSGAEFLMEIPL